MKVFLVSSYHGGSHRSWAEGYAASSDHDVRLITLPGAFWQWRLTGGFVSLADELVAAATAEGTPDAILTTSMVDVAGLRGLVSRHLGSIPTALYMHENQVTYPALGRSRTERNYGLINWTSLIAADAVAFNSAFHRDGLFGALPGFLREFPDERHGGLVDEIAAASIVLPVGCDLSSIPSGPKDDPPLILWNHRWDPDKDPAAFLESMTRLAATGARFGIALTGERFVQQRPGHDDAIDALGDLVVVDGYLDRRDYLDVLGRSTIVMSSAHQEFFGVSVVEAMAAGAVPILPHRLVYSERVPSDCVARTLYRTQDEAVDLLIAAVEGGEETRSLGTRLAATVRDYDWSVVAPSYDRWLQTTVTS